MTLLHADPTLPALVHAAALPWDPSPAAGVHRRRIERTGGEVARLTSLVRYGPGSRFPEHRHGGGEEYLVLSGTFSDEQGDHRAGTYVRNGVGSRHSPFTDEGCVILVKLWWMHQDETASSIVSTSEGWRPTDWGARQTLHDGVHDQTAILRLSPGASLTLSWRHGLELFCIDGAADLAGTALLALSWVRRPDHGALSLQSVDGALLYIKQGHLSRPPELPS